MKRQWLFGALVCLGIGCDAVLGIETGIPLPDAPPAPPQSECEVVADCKVDEPACRSVQACTDGKCVFDDVPNGTALVPQVAGDCGEWVCDGQGQKRFDKLESDAPDDGNDCTQDSCNGSTPVHINICSCGDGKVTPSLGEECDDGNTSDADDCLTTCKRPHVLQVVAGSYHTCALLPGGVVKCWGGNEFGQLGLGHTESIGNDAFEMGAKLKAVDLGTAQVAVAIAAGYYHTCALLSSGNVKCWGKNDEGQLGLGDTNNRGDGLNEMGENLPFVNIGTGVQVATVGGNGARHVCVLTTTGRVKCWGSNWYGILGLGNKTDNMIENNRGDDANEMGDNLPYVDLGMNVKIDQLSVGAGGACVLLVGGNVKCWGLGYYGALGYGDKNDRGDEPGEMGDSLPAVDLGTNQKALALAAGSSVNCALLAPSGDVKCWGWQGIWDQTRVGDDPEEMGDKLLKIDLGTGKYAQTLGISFSHTCARLTDNTLKCWGQAGSCVVGFNSSTHIDDPYAMGDALLPTINLGTNRIPTAITVGGGHTCTILSNGAVTCWGLNHSGQLGLAEKSDYRCPGDNLPTVKLFSNEW